MPESPQDEHAPEAAPEQADLALLARLRAFFEATDPVPDDLAEEALIAATVQTLNAELAELTSPMLAGVREEDPAGMDVITFSGESGSLTVSGFGSGPGDLALDGWVTPGGATVELHGGTVVRRVVSDMDGRFVVTDLPRGTWWFVVLPADPKGEARAMVTPRIEL